MDTRNQSCEAVIAEVARALRAEPPVQPPATIVAHLSSCPRCRAGLALFVSAAASTAPDSGGCEPCQADLAAFLERERTDPDGAAADYPHVWQHLWTCPDCLDDYLTSRSWLEEEQAGLVAPLRLPTPSLVERAIGAIRRIVIERAVLRLALPSPQLALAPVRGPGGDGFLLFEDGENPSQAHFTVMVRDSGDGTWQMEVITRPPLVGLLRLSAGETRLTAPFLPNGSATIRAIPFSLLADGDAPDIELIVLPVDGAPGV